MWMIFVNPKTLDRYMWDSNTNMVINITKDPVHSVILGDNQISTLRMTWDTNVRTFGMNSQSYHVIATGRW